MALPESKRKIAQMIHAFWIACPIRSPQLLLLLLFSTIWPPKYTNAATLITAANDSSEIFDYEPIELSSLAQRGGSVERDVVIDAIAEPNVDFRNNFNENKDDNRDDDEDDEDGFDDVKDYMNDFTLQEAAADASLLKDVYDQQPIGNEDYAISSNGRDFRDRRPGINASQAPYVLRNEPERKINVDAEKDASESFDTRRMCKNVNEGRETQLNGREYDQRCNEGVPAMNEYQRSDVIINEEEEDKRKTNLMQENRRNDDELLLKTNKDERRVLTKPITPATTAAILSKFLHERSTVNYAHENIGISKHINEPKDDNNEFTSSDRPEAARNAFMASPYQKLYENPAAQKNEQNYGATMATNNSQLIQNNFKTLHDNRSIKKIETARSSLELPDIESYTESYISQQLQQQGQKQQQFKNEDEKIVQLRDIIKNPTYELLFEKYKAERRNNQRTGHKVYKKKYKDYLKFGTPSTTTTTTTMLTDQTIEKYNKKNNNDGDNYSRHNLINSTNNISKTNNKHARQQQPSTRLQKYVKLTQAKQQQQQQQQQKQQKEQQSGELTSPIFALQFNEYTTKPFYQGQINYYQDTDENDDDELVDDNWLKDLNGMRDEIKKNTHEEHPNRNKKQNRFAGRHRLLTRNNRRQKHQHHQHHHHHQLHQHQRNHYRRRQEHNKDKAYQSFGVAMKEESIAQTSTPPLPTPASTRRQPLRELGHQITEIKELEHFYAKWPHLAQVQAYERSMRPATNSATDDEYDEDYESAAELEEAQNDNNEDANLPPYIKKYNRRNKQLLNLLEGTLPPPPTPTMRIPDVQAKWSSSLLQPGPHESSNGGLVIRAYNENHVKDKRPHHRNQNASQRRVASSKRFDTLFAQQSHTAEPLDYAFSKSSGEAYNQLPDEYVDASNECPENSSTSDGGNDAEFRQKTPPYGSEVNLSNQRTRNAEKKKNASSETTSGIIRKAALYKLPSYPAIGSSFVGTPRSRSAQFVSNVAGRGNSYVHVGGLSSEKSLRRPSTSSALENLHNSMLEQAPKSQQRFGEINRGASQFSRRDHAMTTTTPKSLNSFAYHRVEAPAPLLRNVGVTERKQHLPFVAITDRRLESFKKTLTSSHKDFKNNNLSMP